MTVCWCNREMTEARVVSGWWRWKYTADVVERGGVWFYAATGRHVEGLLCWQLDKARETWLHNELRKREWLRVAELPQARVIK